MVALLFNRPSLIGVPGPANASPVKVIYGANDLILTNMAGHSVAAIHIGLRDVLNAPRWCVPFVNGVRVGRHHRLLPGDTLKFVYPWGFKGSDEQFLSAAEFMAWRGITAEHYEQLRQRGLPSVRGKDGESLHSRKAVKDWFSVVPPGTPKWITGEEIEDTLRVWQRSYEKLLTPDDAVEILLNTRNLLDVLFPLGGNGKEAVR